MELCVELKYPLYTYICMGNVVRVVKNAFGILFGCTAGTIRNQN